MASQSRASENVEFRSYDLNFWPPKPREPTMITPLAKPPLDTERLSDDLLIVFDRTRRLGFLATNNWLDIDQFRMASGRPPEENLFRQIPGRNDPNYRQLEFRYHMKAATMLFKTICRSPDVTPDRDRPVVHYGFVPEPSHSVAEYIEISSVYNPPSHMMDLRYLLLSRAAVTRLAHGEWAPKVFARSRIGDIQLQVLDRLVDQPKSPYTSPDYNFDS